jgi:mannose-6-phosphate isomerase-like protein (cupin superfamily)
MKKDETNNKEDNLHPVQIKPKPWGREIWFAQNDNYAGKILELTKGHRYSLQYHEQKKETQYIYSGKIKMHYGNNEENIKHIILNPGDKFDVLPYTIHRAQALEDSKIFEVSTPELDDVVKLHDDYGRKGKGNNEELDQKLHNGTQST